MNVEGTGFLHEPPFWNINGPSVDGENDEKNPGEMEMAHPSVSSVIYVGRR